MVRRTSKSRNNNSRLPRQALTPPTDTHTTVPTPRSSSQRNLTLPVAKIETVRSASNEGTVAKALWSRDYECELDGRDAITLTRQPSDLVSRPNPNHYGHFCPQDLEIIPDNTAGFSCTTVPLTRRPLNTSHMRLHARRQTPFDLRGLQGVAHQPEAARQGTRSELAPGVGICVSTSHGDVAAIAVHEVVATHAPRAGRVPPSRWGSNSGRPHRRSVSEEPPPQRRSPGQQVHRPAV